MCLQKRKACYLERIGAGRRPVGVGTIPVPFLRSIPSADNGQAQFRHGPDMIPGPWWCTRPNRALATMQFWASRGSSRCMMVYDRPLAIPRLSPLIFGCVPAYEWLHSQPSRDPLSLSGAHPPKHSMHCSRVNQSSGRWPTIHSRGPTNSQCFCHHPCNDVLVSPTATHVFLRVIEYSSVVHRTCMSGPLSLVGLWISCQ